MKRPEDERWRLTACAGKRGFSSWEQANAVRKRGSRNRDAKRQVYRCAFCGQLHLGQPNGKKRHGKPKDFQPPESGIT